jgi:periplasmic divalent cation tolerance protein
MTEAAVVLTTVGSQEAASSLARRLVEAGLAACVQLIPIESVYRWEGEVVEEGEVLLLVKIRRARYDDVEQAILDGHPYETPEVVMLPVEAGLPAYLSWLAEVTAPPAPGSPAAP